MIRITQIKISIDEPVSKDQIAGKGIEISKEIEGGFEMTVKGEIEPFIKKLSKFKVESVQINQANLEEIFMEFYK